MLVCSCRTVSDRTVSAAIAAGAGDVEEIGRRCGAGTRCGGCHPELRRLLGCETAVHGGDLRVAV